jgi:hypothetical protein
MFIGMLIISLQINEAIGETGEYNRSGSNKKQ